MVNLPRGWGSEGSNGGIRESNLSEQTVSGDILVDAISELVMTISGSSSYTGAINSDGDLAASLIAAIDASSTWILTGDSYITGFEGSMDTIVTNGYTLYVNGIAVN